MAQFFTGLYHYFFRHKWQAYLFFFSIVAISAFFAVKLKFEEDISRILPKDKKVEKLNHIFQHSKFMDKLVIMVSLKDTTSTDPASLIAFGDQFSLLVEEKLSPYVRKVNYKLDDELTMKLFDVTRDHLPVYLTERDYLSIDSLIDAKTVKNTLVYNIRTLSSPAGFALKTIIQQDPVGISFIALRKLQQLQYDENFELYDNAVVTKDHKNLLIFLTPVYAPNNTGKNTLFLRELDRLIADQTAAEFPAISVSYFGATAVSTGNATQLQRDSLFTQTATVILLILFIGFYFRRVAAPVLVMIPVIFGALFALMMVYFIQGSISIIAIGTGSVILGIAVNYSLHVFNHYRHTQNMHKVINDLAFPLTLGGFTTIGGFFCLSFAASDMLKDLGLFAGFSLIGASLCSLIFLPHFLVVSGARKDSASQKHSLIDRIAMLRPDQNRTIIIGIVILTVIFSYTSRKVAFETELNNMNYMSANLKGAEAKLNHINEAALQSVYLVADGKTLDDALVHNEKLLNEIEDFKSRHLISRYSGVHPLLISDSLQRLRIARWNQYWTKEKKNQLLDLLKDEGKLLGYSSTAFIPFEALLEKSFQPVDRSSVDVIRNTLLNDYITEDSSNVTVVTLLKIPSENKQIVYTAFEDRPNATILDRQFLTGKFVELINADFTYIAFITSLLVFFVLLITYGRIELTLMAFLPMAISWVWIIGIMGLLGIKFNIINIIVSTLIFGLGDDYSIFIMDGLLQEYKTGKKNLSSFKSSIILSAVTTITGLGVLIFAKHPALRSIAMISVIGILSVVLVAQICIPFLFHVLIRNRIQKHYFPWTFWGFLKTLFSQVWFLTGSIIVSFLGFVFIQLNPFNKDKGRYWFHVAIAGFSKSLIYIMANVKKAILNPLHEDFRKPAIIICNHQSGLDNFLMMMQHPKLIVLTNDRVRNAPVSGAIVRMADYYSASSGIENSLPAIEKKVEQGYSVVIFPEGTRSTDGRIRRFHKGAFYLAEKLNLDILPVIIHGSGYTLSKNDILVKDGKITIQYLPRITPEQTDFGTGYREKTKSVRQYMSREYEKLRGRIEDISWFREQLFYNYIYKGPVLEWYTRVKVRLEKDYKPIHNLLPQKGRLLDLGCGYGFMAYMLHFAAGERDILGIDYDEEKIRVAAHCFSRDARIRFEHADVLKFPLEKYDGIIMADMLHYLTPEQQRLLIEKCLASLNEHGVLVIRDGDKDLREKHKGTELTEFFSTKLLRFNKTAETGLSFLSGSMISELADRHGFTCRRIDETKYTSNVIFVIQNHPGRL